MAINGLGRIGRAFLKLAMRSDDIDVVAINDLGELENLAYLLRYDSAYGRSELKIEVKADQLIIDGRPIICLHEKDPAQLPWSRLSIGVVVESTGFFENYDEARRHIDAGARKVVISAPAKGKAPAGLTTGTILMGLNDEQLDRCQISSNASCTTNAASPVIKILHESLGIEKAMLSTVHAYTASQKLVDAPDAKDFRRGRAAAANIVPSTTGAATAVTEAMPELTGRFNGIAIRVPVITGSLVDLTFVAKRHTSKDEINSMLKKAAAEPRWQRIFTTTNEPLVSSDIVGNTHASIADLGFTTVVDGNLVKVLSWYDNEMGYAHTLVEHVIKTGAN